MKFYFKILLPIILFGIIFFLFLNPRSNERMEKVAFNELENYLGEGFDTTNYNVQGPIVNKTREGYTTFQWYKVLPWDDTASIFIDVSQSLTSLSWRDNYFFPRITMNYKWNYLLGSTSKLEDVLPLKFDEKIYLNTQLKLYPNHERYFDSSELTIEPERLFFFLKEGCFRVLKKEDDYTIVEFYEPIGNVFYKNKNKIDTMSPTGAMVFVNEAFEMLIVPYKIPDELW